MLTEIIPLGLTLESPRGPRVQRAILSLRRLITGTVVAATTLSVLTAPASAQSPQLSAQWRQRPALAGYQTNNRFVLADMNGDGREDHVQIDLVRSAASNSNRASLAVSGQLEGQPWQILDIARVPPSGRIVALRRPGRDAVAMVVTGPGPGSSRELILYSGIPLVEERRAPIGDESDVVAIDDIDADGAIEAIEIGEQPYPATGSYVRSRDLDSGQIEWSIASSARHVTLAQLDADAALEVVLDASPGLVVDGADGLIEWSYAGGFDDAPLAGNLDANPTSIELISVVADDAVVFSTAPYSPVRDFPLPCCTQSTALGDFDADGVDEFVVLDNSGVRIHSMLGGSARLLPFPSSVFTRDVMVGHVDSSPGPEIVLTGYGAGSDSTNASVLIVNATSGAVTARTNTSLGVPMPLAVDDLDGDGQSELIAPEIHYTTEIDPHLSVRSLQTGEQLRRVTVPTPHIYFEQSHSTNLVTRQLDADIAREVVFGLRELGETELQTRIFVVDGLTLATQRSFVLRDAQNAAVLPIRIAVADVDTDGQAELVVVSNELRAYVFDLDSGTLEWRSPPLPATTEVSIDLIQSDADAAIELLVGTGSRLLAFDGLTHSLDWSRDFSNPSPSRAFTSTANGDCRIAVVQNPGRVLTSRCNEHAFVEAVGFSAVGRNLLWVGWPDDSSDLVATDGRTLLHWSEHTQVVTELGVGAGENAGDDGKGISWIRDESGATRLVMASDGELGSFLLRTDVLFANGFEPGDQSMSRSAQ